MCIGVEARYTIDSCQVWTRNNSPLIRQYGIAGQVERR